MTFAFNSNNISPNNFDDYFMKTHDLIDSYAGGCVWGWGDNSRFQLGVREIFDNVINEYGYVYGYNIVGDNYSDSFVNFPILISNYDTDLMFFENAEAGGNSTLIYNPGIQYSLVGNGVFYDYWGTNINNYQFRNDFPIGRDSNFIRKLSVGGTNFICSIDFNNILYGLGENSNFQLGVTLDNSYTCVMSSAVQIGLDWEKIDCGKTHTSGIKTDGSLWAWGYNSGSTYGETLSSPTQITNEFNWVEVSAGTNYSAAIDSNNSLWLWGNNNRGQLGRNNGVLEEDLFHTIDQTVCNTKDWKKVCCGDYHTAAIKVDGTLWCWGDNYFGELGNNSTDLSYSPTQTVCLGNNWKQVSCGYCFTVAVKTDGSLWAWGLNDKGQLGVGRFEDRNNKDLSNRSSPVQIIGVGNNWKSVSCGYAHVVAVQYIFQNSFSPHQGI